MIAAYRVVPKASKQLVLVLGIDRRATSDMAECVNHPGYCQ
jgi:hypothetical protein